MKISDQICKIYNSVSDNEAAGLIDMTSKHFLGVISRSAFCFNLS